MGIDWRVLSRGATGSELFTFCKDLWLPGREWTVRVHEGKGRPEEAAGEASDEALGDAAGNGDRKKVTLPRSAHDTQKFKVARHLLYVRSRSGGPASPRLLLCYPKQCVAQCHAHLQVFNIVSLLDQNCI